MEKHRYGPARGGGDLVVQAVELDDVAEVDFATGAQRKMEVQHGGVRRWTEAGGAVEDLIVPDLFGHLAGGSKDFAVLALDFHLEDLVGMLPRTDFFVSHEGDESVLKCAETSFDLALGLRGGSDEVGDLQRPQGTLELAPRITVVVAGTGTEEAQAVGVDGLWQAMAFDGLAEVLEVVPSRVPLHEAATHEEARTVVGRQQQSLFFEGRPPPMDRAVMLPKFPDMSTPEATVDAGFGLSLGDQVGEVCFDIGLDGRPCPLELVQSFQFVCDELEIRRALYGKEVFEESNDLGGPLSGAVTPTGSRLITRLVFEPCGPKFVNACAAHAEPCSGTVNIQRCAVEVMQDLPDE